MEAGAVLVFSLIVLRLVMWVSIAATWVHCFQEVAGMLPDYFERIHDYYRMGRKAAFALRLPRPVAVLLFGPGLAIVLTVLSVVGHGNTTQLIEPGDASSIALAALCGARLGDAVLSHILLAWFERPNPGLSSCVLYVLEGGLLLVYLQWGAGEIAAAAIAAGAFAVVNPLIGVVSLRLYDGTESCEERGL